MYGFRRWRQGNSRCCSLDRRFALVSVEAATLSSPRAEYYLLWTRNEMLLDGRSLRDVADELERHFGIRVVLGAALADETLDGQIVLDEPGRVLQDIALLLGAQLEIADNTYLLN